MEPETMSSSQAAAALGCSRQNVADLLERGRIVGPPRERGERVRVYTQSLRTYQQHRAASTTAHAASQPVVLHSETEQQLLAALFDLQLEVSRLRAAFEAVEEARSKSPDAKLSPSRSSQSKRLADLNSEQRAADAAELKNLKTRLAANKTERRRLQTDIANKKAAQVRWTLAMEEAGLFDNAFSDTT